MHEGSIENLFDSSGSSDNIKAGPDDLRHRLERAVRERMLSKLKHIETREMHRLDVIGRRQQDHQQPARLKFSLRDNPERFGASPCC
jgi:hypothetical protein